MRKSNRVAVAALPVAAAAEKRNHYGNMEEQICDLLRAADLSAALLDDTLSEGNVARENSSCIYLPEQFQERLIFAAYEVQKRAQALQDFMYAGALTHTD
jgi:hypothetical protein